MTDRFTLELKSFPNKKLVDEIIALEMECFGPELCGTVREPRIDELLGWRNSAGNIMLSALVIFMSVFNILLVFKYMSVGVAAAAFVIIKMLEIEAAVGLVLSPLNLIVSLITIAALVLAAAVVPIILTAKKPPAEYFRRVL